MVKRKILVLTPRLPVPVVGGDKLRIYGLCRGLSKEFDVSLLSLCASKEEMSLEHADLKIFAEVQRIVHSKFRVALNLVRGIFSHQPLQHHYYWNPLFAKKFAEVYQSYDAVLVHLTRMAPYVEGVNLGHPVLLEMTDAISLNYSRLQKWQTKSVGKFWRAFYKFEQEKMLRYELSSIAKFPMISLIADVDRKYLLERHNDVSGDGKLVVIPNGVDCEKFKYIGPSHTNLVVFIGNMRTVPNFEACDYFARNVLPELRRMENYTFRIIGMAPEKVRRHFAQFPGVEVTGAVNDIAEACEGALAAVCPMHLGAGLQNKVLEYFALGLPTVSTSVGLEGIVSDADKQVAIVANSTMEWVSSIASLKESAALRESLSENARSLVMRSFSWRAVEDDICKKMHYLIDYRGDTSSNEE